MCESIESKLPNDVLDELIVSRQDHTLSYFADGKYTEEDLNGFVNQCRSFDLIRSRNLYVNSLMHNHILEKMYEEIQVYQDTFDEESLFSATVRDNYVNNGLQFIANGKLAIVLLAGGQATRMRPGVIKGCLDIGLPSHKLMFRRFCESILALEKEVRDMFHKEIHQDLFIMTNEFNEKKIKSTFRDNDYFGLQPSQLHFFTQGSFPCVNDEGGCLMREKYRIALSPNGSGGIFSSIRKWGIIDQWKSKGVEYVHIFSNDNAAVIPGDPVFVGYCLAHDSDVCIECVEKTCPEEQLSMIAKYGNRPMIAVSSEMSYRQECKRNLNGELVFRYGFICNSLLKLSFIVNHCHESSLPAYCHIVRKAVPYYDTVLNRTIKPVSPNGFQMEYYISDVFPLAKQLDVLVVPREKYIPINNLPGKPIESPEVAVRLLSSKFKQLLEANGVVVEEDPSLRSVIEISPLVSYRGNGLSQLRGCRMRVPLLLIASSEVGDRAVTRLSEHLGQLVSSSSVNTYVVLSFI